MYNVLLYRINGEMFIQQVPRADIETQLAHVRSLEPASQATQFAAPDPIASALCSDHF